MLLLSNLLQYLDQLLNVSVISDYAPNGLQIEGRPEINKIVTGVTACQALLNAAIEEKADAIIVHHGYFWRNESPVVTGIKRQRIGLLLKHNISLLAYHLPLDTHITLGNNTQLGEQLGIITDTRLKVDGINDLVCLGHFPENLAGDEFARTITKILNRNPLHIAAVNRPIKRIAWCTGAAERYLDLAIDLNVDAYLTGEISESSVHLAREANIHFYSAGHHATERYGIKVLGEHLAETFLIKHEFIDIPNPV